MALGSSVLQRRRAFERLVRFLCLQLFQDNPIGDWDGMIDGKLLCNFASLEHTKLVPICDVMPGESLVLFLLCFILHAVFLSVLQKHAAVPLSHMH